MTNLSTMQTVLDAQADHAIERGDFEKGLRVRWLSHANSSATYEPDDVAVYLQELRQTTDLKFPVIGK